MLTKALILVDLQNDFIHTAPQFRAVNNVTKYVKPEPGWVYIYTLDTHDKDTYMDTLEAKQGIEPHCLQSTFGWSLIVEPVQGAVLLEKSSFGGAARGITQATPVTVRDIYICGICTDICVVSIALALRSLYNQADVSLHVLEPLCAGVDRVGHDSAITVMQRCGWDIIDSLEGVEGALK